MSEGRTETRGATLPIREVEACSAARVKFELAGKERQRTGGDRGRVGLRR